MLKRFSVCNYKNFKDKLEIRFDNVSGYKFSEDCINNGLISKMIIYGKNATGKTNLGTAITDIFDLIIGGTFYRRSDEMYIVNADNIYSPIQFSYTFVFDDKEVLYEYSKNNNNHLLSEALIVGGEQVFSFNYQEHLFEYKGLHLIDADDNGAHKYIADLKEMDQADEIDDSERIQCFLRWLLAYNSYSEGSLSEKISNYVRRMRMVSSASPIPFMRKYPPNRAFFNHLSEEKNLRQFEKFLNEMGVECELVLKKNADDTLELFFKHDTLIPFFSTASSGTRALFDLYRRIIFSGARIATFLYLDEFDAFYHYSMSEAVLNYIKKEYPDTQVVFTTHNTNLLSNRIMRPDCLFVLSRSGKLTSYTDATSRELREGHNLAKMYISGEFEDYE